MQTTIPAITAAILTLDPAAIVQTLDNCQPIYHTTDSLNAICAMAQKQAVYFCYSIRNGYVLASEYRPNPAAEAYTVESEPWQAVVNDDSQLPRKVTPDAVLFAIQAFNGIYQNHGSAIIGIQRTGSKGNGSYVIRVLGVIPKDELPTRYKRDIYS